MTAETIGLYVGIGFIGLIIIIGIMAATGAFFRIEQYFEKKHEDDLYELTIEKELFEIHLVNNEILIINTKWKREGYSRNHVSRWENFEHEGYSYTPGAVLKIKRLKHEEKLIITRKKYVRPYFIQLSADNEELEELREKGIIL